MLSDTKRGITTLGFLELGVHSGGAWNTERFWLLPVRSFVRQPSELYVEQ